MPPLTIVEARKIYQIEKQKEKKLYRRGMDVNRIFTEHGNELLRQVYDLLQGPGFDFEDYDAFDPVKMFQYRSKNSDIIDIIGDIEELRKAQMTPEAKRVFKRIDDMSLHVASLCRAIRYNWDGRVNKLMQSSEATDDYKDPLFRMLNSHERELMRELKNTCNAFDKEVRSGTKDYIEIFNGLKEYDAKKLASLGGLSATVKIPAWINNEVRLKSYYLRVFTSALQKTNPELLQKIYGGSLEQIENYAARNNLTRERVIARCEYEDLTRYYREYFKNRQGRQTEMVLNLPLSLLEEKAKSEYGVDRNYVYALGCYNDLANYYKRFIAEGCARKGWSRPQTLNEANDKAFTELQNIAQKYFGADAGNVYSWAVINSISTKTVDWESPTNKFFSYVFREIKASGVDNSDAYSLQEMLNLAKDKLNLDVPEIEARGRNYDLTRYYHDYLLALKNARPDSIDLPENYEQLNLNQLWDLSGKCKSYYIKEEDVVYWGAQADLKKNYIRFIEAASTHNNVSLPRGYKDAPLNQLESYTAEVYKWDRNWISGWGTLKEIDLPTYGYGMPNLTGTEKANLPLNYFIKDVAEEKTAEAEEKEKASKEINNTVEQPSNEAESQNGNEYENEEQYEEDEEYLRYLDGDDATEIFRGKVSDASTITNLGPTMMQKDRKHVEPTLPIYGQSASEIVKRRPSVQHEDQVHELGPTMMQKDRKRVEPTLPIYGQSASEIVKRRPSVQQNLEKTVTLGKSLQQDARRNVTPYLTEIKALRSDLKATLSPFSSDSDAFNKTLKYLDGLTDIDTYDESLISRVFDKLSEKVAAYQQHAIDNPRPGNERRENRLAIMGKIAKLAENFKKGVPNPREEFINKASESILNTLSGDHNTNTARAKKAFVKLESYNRTISELSTYQLEKIAGSPELARKTMLKIANGQKNLEKSRNDQVKNDDGPVIQ